jgi:nucleoid DNA-binding protein
MRKTQLATRLAKQSGVSKAEAADRLDHVVSQIISDLRNGRPAQLPGLGHFTPGSPWHFEFDKKPKEKGGGNER